MKELYEQGRATFSQLMPDGAQRLEQIFASAPDLGELAVGVVYGHLHHRTALDPRTREAVALSAIVASGCTTTPLAVHVRTGLAAGLAPGEIVEILIESAAFTGFPRAVEALSRVTDIFQEEAVPKPPSATPRQAALTYIDAARQRPETALGRLVTTQPAPRVVGVDSDQALALFLCADHTDPDPDDALTAASAVVHFREDTEGLQVTILSHANVTRDTAGSPQGLRRQPGGA